jgi:signal peptidase I
MDWTNWLLLFIIIQIIHGLGTWKMHIAAGHKAWQAFIPVYNAVVMTKIINRPWWYTLLLFLPVVNLIMFIVVWVELLRSFRYNRYIDTVLAIMTLGFYLYYVNYMQPLNYVENRNLEPSSKSGQWTSSILFAVVAATIVHTYVMQPFIIPTSSLEKTLLTGDFLLVSKFHYGPRVPMTPIAAPMVHDTIPLLHVKSYLDRPQIPYTRIPGFTKIKRNDIVVFNYPADTMYGYPSIDGKYHYKPIDKKSNYVKRCVGLPGDSLSIINGKVHINGAPLELPERAKVQYSYISKTKNRKISAIELKDKYDITDGFQQGYDRENDPAAIIAAATDEAAAALAKDDNFINLERSIENAGLWRRNYFPYDSYYENNNDHFVPFLIPEKGTTTPVNYLNISFYKRIIEVYEGSEMGIDNKLDIQGKRVLLNGKPLTQYTFKQNYYWLMGDNRHNSADSRVWGYVPENHVVGKPVFVWMSMDWKGKIPKLRFDRMFTTVNGPGQPTSYLIYFLIVLAGYFVFKNIRKRKKNK